MSLWPEGTVGDSVYLVEFGGDSTLVGYIYVMPFVMWYGGVAAAEYMGVMTVAVVVE